MPFIYHSNIVLLFTSQAGRLMSASKFPSLTGTNKPVSLFGGVHHMTSAVCKNDGSVVYQLKRS